MDADGLGADEQLLADLAVGAALGDQREDLALARRSARRSRRRRGPGADPSARSSSSSGCAPSRCAAARARSPTSRAPARSPVARRIPASAARDRASSCTSPKSSKSDRVLAPGVDQHVERRGVDAGEPARPQRLGVQPLHPGPPLGTPEAGRVGVAVEHGVAVGVQPLDVGEVRRPLGRRQVAPSLGASAPTATAASRIRALNHSCQIRVSTATTSSYAASAPAGSPRRPAWRDLERGGVDGDPALARPEAAQRGEPRRPRRRRGPNSTVSRRLSSSARGIGGGAWSRTSQSASALVPVALRVAAPRPAASGPRRRTAPTARRPARRGRSPLRNQRSASSNSAQSS